MLLQYVIRRTLQMIPIVFGVVLLTFVLFHVVGGSPASMVLGKNATARALGEYDRQHGFDRPLFWGSLLKTRAFQQWDAAQDFRDDPEPGVTRVEDHALYGVLQYALNPNTEYVLRMKARTRNAGAGTLGVCLNNGTPGELHEFGDGSAMWRTVSQPEYAKIPLPPLSARFRSIEVSFQTAEETDEHDLLLVVVGQVEVRDTEVLERVSDPWNSQFFNYLKRLSRFDLGVSSGTQERVSAILKRGAWPSLVLNVPILIGGTLLAVLMALLCAWRRDRAMDRFMVVAATVLMSVNYIVWIVAGQYFLAYRLGWFPIWGFESWRYLLLPVFIGIATGLGRDVRFYRTVMLEEVAKDYVKTAEAKGLGAGRILFRHVLKNALPPIITNVSLSLPFLFTGSLLLESFFGIPGLGGLSVNAINSSDMAVVQAVVLIGALLYVVVNLLTDVCYALVDPRVRLR
ncbi:MAG: ABC transporter permease subunit [Kiritimatiellae bacterium]|nr:ABC transporter permease subunit [Kiritimatiellia bacterium]